MQPNELSFLQRQFRQAFAGHFHFKMLPGRSMHAVKLYPSRYAKRQHVANFGTNARRCLCVGHDLQLVRAGKGDNVRTLRQALRRAKMQGTFPPTRTACPSTRPLNKLTEPRKL